MQFAWKKRCAGAGGALLLLTLSIGLILLAYLDHEAEEEEDAKLLITNRQGTLKGRYLTSRKGRQILSFTRIPYAKPPIGNLRFKVRKLLILLCPFDVIISRELFLIIAIV